MMISNLIPDIGYIFRRQFKACEIQPQKRRPLHFNIAPFIWVFVKPVLPIGIDLSSRIEYPQLEVFVHDKILYGKPRVVFHL